MKGCHIQATEMDGSSEEEEEEEEEEEDVTESVDSIPILTDSTLMDSLDLSHVTV